MEIFDEKYYLNLEGGILIYPAAALAKLQSGDSGWERMVTPEVVQIIKEREFFGYRAPIAA